MLASDCLEISSLRQGNKPRFDKIINMKNEKANLLSLEILKQYYLAIMELILCYSKKTVANLILESYPIIFNIS